jgi:hypothetical protein
VGTIPAKADVEKQQVFKQTELEPRLAEARAGKPVVVNIVAAFFTCAVGLLLGFPAPRHWG